MRTSLLALLTAGSAFAAAPVVSNVSVNANSSTTLAVTWTTNIVGDSCVGYSTVSGGPYTYPGGSATAALCVQDLAATTGLATAHTYILWGLSASTKYYIVPVSTDGAGNSTTGAEVSATTLAAPTTYPLAFSLSGTTKYNDGYHGQNNVAVSGNYESGDTHHFTYADDGNYYSTVNDTPTGPNGAWASGTKFYSCANYGRNLAVLEFSASNLFAEKSANSMDTYGNETCTNTGGWSDGYTWKSGGLVSIHGTLYLTAYRQQTGSPWTGTNSVLIKSPDHGAHWCNPADASATGCTTASATGDAPGPTGIMWSGFRAPTAIQYCQDNSNCANPVDNADQWTYFETVNNSDSASFYLMRVKTVELPLLQVSKFYYYTGGDGNLDSSWSTSSASAALVSGLTASAVSTIYYISTRQRYLWIGWLGGGGGWRFYEAPHPWGPWTATYYAPSGIRSLDFPSLLLGTLTSHGSYDTVTMSASGDATMQTSVQDTNGYSLYYQTLTIASQPSPTAQAFSSPVRNVQAGDSDVITRGLQAFYELWPQAGTSVIDESGQGNNATANSSTPSFGAAPFSEWADTSFNGSYTINTPVNPHTWTDFTFLVVAKHYAYNAPVSAGQVFNDYLSSVGFNPYRPSSTTCNGTGGTLLDAECLNFSGTQVISTAMTFTDGAWQLFVYRRSGSTLTIYDGSTFDSTAKAITPLATGTTSGSFPNLAIQIGANWKGSVALFAAHNVALTDLELKRQVAAIRKRLGRHGIAFPAPIGSGYVLDNQPAPITAYSVRRLFTSYAGPAMNVRRASDSTTTDIPFNSTGDIDTTGTGPLMTFCAATSCYVAKWYDQSGHHFDAANATTTAQPTVVSSGTVQTLGSHLTLATNSSSSLVTPAGQFYLYGPQATLMTAASLSSGGSYGFVGALNDYATQGSSSGSLVTSGTLFSEQSTGANIAIYRNSEATPTAQAVTFGTQFSGLGSYDGYQNRLRVNGNSSNVATNIASTGNFFDAVQENIGGAWNGKISEVITWPAGVASSTYAAIRATHQSYFGTP